MAFNPVQYSGGNRAYVQGNVVRQPDVIQGGGFASLGNIGRGFGDLAYGIGAVGEVIDNWGASKRAEARERDAGFAERAQYFHPDQIDEVLNDPETLARWAESAGYSDVDKFRGQLEMSKHANTQERAKMISRERFNTDSPEGAHLLEGEEVPPDDHQGPPGEVQDQPPETVQDEEFVGPTQAQAGLEEAPPEATEVYDPELEESAELQFDEYQAQLEDEALPDTDQDMEAEYYALNTPQEKIPNPTRLEEVGRRGSRAVMDHMKNRKIYADMMYYYASRDQQLDPATANEVANRMSMSDEALVDGMRSYALEKLSHIPPDQAEYFNNPQYFMDAVAFQRYQVDREFARQVDSQPGELERIMGSVSKLPFLWKKTMGEAVVGTATQAQAAGLEYLSHDREVAAQAEVRRVNTMNYNNDLLRIGHDQQRIELEKKEVMSRLGISKAQLEMEWEKHGIAVQDQYRRWDMQEAEAVLKITDQKAKLYTQIWTNQNQMYQTISSVGKLEGQTQGGKMLIDLMEAEMELAKASQIASAKYHPGGNLAGGVEGQDQSGSAFTAADVKRLSDKVAMMRQRIESEYAAAGLDLYVSPGEKMQVDVTQDLSTIRDMMFERMGYDRNWVAKEGRVLDKVRDRFVVSPGSGSIYVPDQLDNYYDRAIREGKAIQEFESEEIFRNWLGERGMKVRDVSGLWKYHQMQTERQRRRVMDEGKYS